MDNFWDFSVWGMLNLVAVLLASMMLANFLKKKIKLLRNSLLPTSVLGGLILLIISGVFEGISGNQFFNLNYFGGNGENTLEVITYHALALGFIASTLKQNKKQTSPKRIREIFDTGVNTVATYLLQAVLGLGITIFIVALGSKSLDFEAAGVLLPFGFGQGPGQALNYGSIYESDYAFSGGRSFGLTIAGLGFLSASLGGVIHLNIMKRKGRVFEQLQEKSIGADEIQTENEIPMNGSMDKLTVQIALVFLVYAVTYVIMYLLGLALPGMKATVYGFNFLFGVLIATLLKAVINGLTQKGVVHKQYTNNFLLDRVSNFFFDLMVVASIAAIRLDAIKQYWWILLLLGIVGVVSTYLYNIFVARKLFPEYSEEQFLCMFGMLTGTASTGIILLREADPHFKTPVADNLIYQNFPAIAFGFPLMFLALLAPKQPLLTLGILLAFFVVVNIILFRSFIFRKRKKATSESTEQ
ncbi:MAG: hypothetical protein IJ492_05985 [Clostridia bacterium]|nr:hypothetical protein [Clostridia bacterium]